MDRRQGRMYRRAVFVAVPTAHNWKIHLEKGIRMSAIKRIELKCYNWGVTFSTDLKITKKKKTHYIAGNKIYKQRKTYYIYH